jgi:23S rRNA (guanosine2251-2'-O)-methyltransferase
MARPGIGDRVEGVHAVTAALLAGRVESLVVESGSAGGLDAVLRAARERGIAVEMVDDVRSLASTSAPQGVVARCRPIRPSSLDEAIAATTPAALLVLDHLEEARNVGAVARSAVAAGFGGLVVPRRRAAPLGATAFKAAAGALEHIRLVEIGSVAATVSDLEGRGIWVVGLDVDGDRPIFGLDLLTQPVALVVGAEGEGLSRLVRERVDLVASIPIRGPVESLNASVAAALAMYEVARMRGM